jgi:hypothetical protein
LSIPVSAHDGADTPGFTEGHPFTLKLWKAFKNKEYTMEPEIIKGHGVFRKYESAFVSLKKYVIGGVEDKQLSEGMGIRIFPNPTDGKVYISHYNLSVKGIQVQVTSATGQMMINSFLGNNPAELDLPGFASGVYFLKVSDGENLKTILALIKSTARKYFPDAEVNLF